MTYCLGLAIASICFAVSCGTIAKAGFKNDYAAWKSMDQYSRYSYIQGMSDGLSNDASVNEQAWVTAMRNGTANCATGLHLTAGMLEGAVTKHYEEFPRDWGLPPVVVFDAVVREVCLDYINAERQKVGLAAWTVVHGSIVGQ